MRKTESKISGQELHCLTRVQLGNQEWHMEVESSIIRSCFEHIWFKLRKKMFFWKRVFFKEASNLWTLYLSKMGPDNIQNDICI